VFILFSQKDDSLLLVKYDGCKMPGKLMGRTFLDWNDKSVKPHFWDRLFKTLGPERVQVCLDSCSTGPWGQLLTSNVHDE
jgi:hypothetical protein